MNKKCILIKRYQNRKLYDTQNSTYVTLDDIAKLIKAGEDVQVIDNKSEEDLTGVTLTQIIFEEGKRNRSLLPLSTLKRIIQDGGDAIKDLVGKTIDTSVSSFSKAKEEAEKVFDRLHDKITPEEGNILQEVIHKTQDFSTKISENVKSAVGSVTHVTSLQHEIRNLRKKIAFLEKRVKDYEK